MGEENKTTVAAQSEPKFYTHLSAATERYLTIIKDQIEQGGAEFDEYSGKCVLSAMSAINNMLHNQGASFNDLDTSNLNEILIRVATLKLNANAVPRECYFQIRNVNVAPKGQSDKWEKQIEFNIEGDGNDAILARFGRDVKKVHQVWLVRENDKFTYPKHNGLEMTAPQWEPTGQGKVIRVVYPIVKNDNTVEYYIGERREVVKNLFAHINNTLMNETFGIITGKNSKGKERTRFDATEEEKKKIAAEKKKILDKVKAINDLDKILDNEELAPYISPAWKEFQSREQMIIRKMRNNVARKIPKDFGSAIAAEEYNRLDDTYREIHAEIEENANQVVFDAEYKEVEEPEPQVQPEPVKEEEPKEESPEPKQDPNTFEEPEGSMPPWMQ